MPSLSYCAVPVCFVFTCHIKIMLVSVPQGSSSRGVDDFFVLTPFHNTVRIIIHMILHLQMLTVQKAKKVLLNNSKYKSTAV